MADVASMKQVSYSTGGFGGHDIRTALDAIAAEQFNCVEVGGCGTCFDDWACSARDDAPAPPTGRSLAAFRGELEKRGLSATTVHAPSRTNVLGAPTQAWRTEKVGVLGQYIRFAAELGAGGIVIHGIPNPCFLPKDCDVATMVQPMVDAMRRSLDELVPVAAAAGTRILLENLPYGIDVSIEYPLIAMRQLRPFVEEFPQEHVGLVVDTGHAWTDGFDPAAEIELAGDRLWGVHLQDAPQKEPYDNHWVPGTGDLDWTEIRAALERVGYAGVWTFEVANGRDGAGPSEQARQTRAFATAWIGGD